MRGVTALCQCENLRDLENHRPLVAVRRFWNTWRRPAPDLQAENAAKMNNPGQVLKAARLEQGRTLADISARTGLPVSTISKLENGKMSLSFDKLTRLSAAIGVDIAQLFDSSAVAVPSATGRRSITRKGEGATIETHAYGHIYPASDVLKKRFVPIIADVHCRSLAEFGELIRHPGEEYAFIVNGAVELHTDLYAPVRLEAGDSIYFDSGMGHAYIAAADGPCRVLSICSGDEPQLKAVFGAENAAAAPSAQAKLPGRSRKVSARTSERLRRR
jgi:transcriptional regulator with XRE-family HTH domain